MHETVYGLLSGEYSETTASANRPRSPYMTRAHAARLRALHANLAKESGERAQPVTSSTAVGHHLETSTSHIAPSPFDETAPRDFVAAAGERVVPDGTAKTNQRFWPLARGNLVIRPCVGHDWQRDREQSRTILTD